MSLATRCTSCGTVFRVVQDQLRVSDGWVRCGRCDAVFNASEGLFDLEREAPPAWSPTQPPAEAPPAVFDADAFNDTDRHEPRRLNGPRDPQTRRAQTDAHDEPPAALGSVAPLPDLPAAPPQDLMSAALARPVDDFGAAPIGSNPDDAWAAAVEGPPDAAETPSGFVDRTGRDVFWQRRRTRAALGGATLLLLVVLAGQVAAQFSDIATARWPGMRPVLAGWCSVAGCSVAAPRRIEEIVVDNSALAPVVGTDALKLGVSLHNRAAFAVAVPSVDLSLTDSAGRLIARRTLRPGDFRVAAASLAPGADLSLQANITAGSAPVTGYTVEIFYP